MARVRDLEWPSRIEENVWEEISQGVPAKDEPFIRKYEMGREALIAQEKKQRSGEYSLKYPRENLTNLLDYAFRQALSPLAREACEIVGRVREQEQRSIWTEEFEGILAQKTGASIYPGMMFSLAKERMEKTKLWQIMRKMPKGALLHAHLDAMVDFDFLFGILFKTPGIHIHCLHSLSTPQELEVAPIKFRFLKAENGRSLSPPKLGCTSDLMLDRKRDFIMELKLYPKYSCSPHKSSRLIP
jgi:adenosine deaminase CECR1